MTCGLHVHRYDRGADVGADIATLDLEDSVPGPSKEEARRLVLPFFVRPDRPEGPVWVVRINSLRTPDGLRDILALIESRARPDALLVPKVDSAQDVLILDQLLGDRLASTFFIVLIETAAGLAAADEIASACPRVRALVFGGADLASELGVPLEWDSVLYARSRTIVAATRAGIPALDVPNFAIRDEEQLRFENQRSRALGFRGKVAVHPRQVPIINQGYSPDPDEVDRARRIVAAAEMNGGQIAVLDGGMIGPPMLQAARRTLALAERLERIEAMARPPVRV
jgi:(S)-citramalyl-CoA lyase